MSEWAAVWELKEAAGMDMGGRKEGEEKQGCQLQVRSPGPP